jgi:hypothetical protein
MKVDTPSEQAAEISRLALALAERATTARVERATLRLAGSKEAAELLDIHPSQFYILRHRKQLPAPVAELACGPIWRVEDLETWRRVTTILKAAS